jgi:hypothetical protein
MSLWPLLTIAAAAAHTSGPAARQIPLSRNEIARLLNLAIPPSPN